ncbi:hypothetical protein [Aliiroseovarius crassostreae]|uniref:hypothetical protein n=1 Tax=Aliiroseovarius crassostreae TaxID=154981 RepID=UPI003C7CCD7A
MFNRIIEGLRISLFFLVALFIWAIWSLEPLLKNNPADFQAAGSIVVAWAILFYGRDRLARENAIHSSNKALLVAAHNSIEARLELHKSIAENTQNMNMMAYAKLIRLLGIRDSELGCNDEAIERLELTVNDTKKHIELHEAAVDADGELSKQLELSNDVESTQKPWTKLLYRAELGFAVFGTLQWGYGDKWVGAAHVLVPGLKHWWY